MTDLTTAARNCLARVRAGKTAQLSLEARAGMIAELSAAGVSGLHRSDAYVAARYDEFVESEHPRAADGKFGEGSGHSKAAAAQSPAPEATHAEHAGQPARIASHPADGHALLVKAKEQGGLTFDPEGGGFPSKGYVVSTHPGHEVVVKGELTEKAVDDYLKSHEKFFKENPNSHFGIWHDTEADKWYLDVSHVTHDRAEATKLAATHNQEAFYDLEKGESVFVKSGAERRIDGWQAWRGVDRRPAEGDGRADRRGGARDSRGAPEEGVAALRAAARNCIARARAGKAAHLPVEARADMVAHLRAAGIPGAHRSDAYVAARYEAEWSAEPGA